MSVHKKFLISVNFGMLLEKSMSEARL